MLLNKITTYILWLLICSPVMLYMCTMQKLWRAYQEIKLVIFIHVLMMHPWRRPLVNCVQYIHARVIIPMMTQKFHYTIRRVKYYTKYTYQPTTPQFKKLGGFNWLPSPHCGYATGRELAISWFSSIFLPAICHCWRAESWDQASCGCDFSPRP